MYSFRQGEIREIGIEVISKSEQNFTIDAADFETTQAGQTQVLDSGLPTIDGHQISTLFSASTPGKFNVTITYTIGPEKFKAKLYVEVT